MRIHETNIKTSERALNIRNASCVSQPWSAGVRTLRCGRNNPGSKIGRGSYCL